MQNAPTPKRPGREGRPTYRLWMTGSLAVIMAAFAPQRGWRDDEVSTERVLKHSRYGVVETAQRIEEAARRQGLTVLARMGGDRPMIVLASSQGGTPVMMDSDGAHLAVPMSVHLREAEDGGADVAIAAVMPITDPRELPAIVAAEIEALPVLVERALS
ncbi:MAG: hypothetical protein JSR59_14585 [Proteobacteria bacterium]|nr:hypothetical protein [Pseudomonadota bacterium]